MPRGDGTGPMGMGAMSGRGAGYCAASAAPGFSDATFGCGFGGRGRGRRHIFYATGAPGWARYGGYGAPYGYPASTPGPEAEKQTLKSQADALQSQLDFVKKRLSDIEGGTAAG